MPSLSQLKLHCGKTCFDDWPFSLSRGTLDGRHFTNGDYIATDAAPQRLMQVLQQFEAKKSAARRVRPATASKDEMEAALAERP